MSKEIEILKTTEKVFFVVCPDVDGLPIVQVFYSESAAVHFIGLIHESGLQNIKFYEGTALLLRDGD